MKNLTGFGKKVAAALLGGALVAIATYVLPEGFAEWQEQLRLLGVAILGWAIRAPGDGGRGQGGPPSALFAIGFAVCCTTGCGGAQRPAIAVLQCTAPPPLELVLDIRDGLLQDGGPGARKITDRLWAMVQVLGKKYGAKALMCAAQEAGNMLHESGVQMSRSSDDSQDEDPAVFARHADLMRRLSE